MSSNRNYVDISPLPKYFLLTPTLSLQKIFTFDFPFSLPDAIPLVNADLELLPIHFLIDPGDDVNEEVTLKRTPSTDDKRDLLHEYMDLIDVPMQTAPFTDSDFRLHTSSWGTTAGAGSDPNVHRVNLERGGRFQNLIHLILITKN